MFSYHSSRAFGYFVQLEIKQIVRALSYSDSLTLFAVKTIFKILLHKTFKKNNFAA